MTFEEQKKAFEAYQNAGRFHPYTCGTDSNHKLLELIYDEKEMKIKFKCPDCGYEQEAIFLNWEMIKEGGA